MRCYRCGRQIPNNNYTRINGSYFCNDCASELGFSLFSMDFNSLDGLNQAINAMKELDFANSGIVCANCGTTLNEFENTGTVGCISCFNTFSNAIAKRMLRTYGSDQYEGRAPGETLDYNYESAPADKPAVKKAKKQSKDITERISKADFGTLSDEQLDMAMKQAVEKEDFALAARIRDEINSRKGGQQ